MNEYGNYILAVLVIIFMAGYLFTVDVIYPWLRKLKKQENEKENKKDIPR